jgi:hypothetical protein
MDPDRPQITIWRICISCWIHKATNRHSEYVIIFAFQLQTLLHERVSLLRYTYIAFLFLISGCAPRPFPIFRTSLCFICQQHVVLLSGHSSKYQKCPKLLNCDDLLWTGIAQLSRTLTERVVALYKYFTQYWTDRIDTKLHCSCFEIHTFCLV